MDDGCMDAWMHARHTHLTPPTLTPEANLTDDLMAHTYIPVTKPPTVIMIGPGTGVAPFKAMVEERTAQRKQLLLSSSPPPPPPPPHEWLFFGCRTERADFYYRKELEGYTAWAEGEDDEGRGLRLVTAFSRDQESKVYVTHRIKEHGAALWVLLAERGASLFVAGSAKRMPTDVMDAVKALAVAHGGADEAEAARFVDRLVRARRYCVESWSV
jgi:sulfite reductase (NADPH) flavoprotein alpha-component